MLNGIITEKEVLDAIKVRKMRTCSTKILSIVDYPFRKPA
jgi:hypothetical protein